MVKNTFISIILLIICLGCNDSTNTKNDNIHNSSLSLLELKNRDLEVYLSRYINEVFSKEREKEKVMLLDISSINEKTIFYISYRLFPFSNEYDLPVSIIKVNNQKVYVNLLDKRKRGHFFTLDSLMINQLNYNEFKSQYEYEKKYGEISIPPSVKMDIWKLTFEGNKLIDKKTVQVIDYEK